MVDLADQNSVGGKTGSQGGRKLSTSMVSVPHFLTSSSSSFPFHIDIFDSFQFRGPDFDGLYTQKRASDQESTARRSSIADQYKTGFLSKMWYKYV